MEKIAHIWNVNQFMTKLDCPQRKNLQTFYLRCCKKLSIGCRLPKQQFGATAMCMHCNSLWTTVDHEIRILRGRPISKSVQKIVESMQDKEKRIPRVRKTLGRKAMKRRSNRMAIKCSVCSKITKMSLAKPRREIVKRVIDTEESNIEKRKKRRTKDRTAGLNIPIEMRLEPNRKLQEEKNVPLVKSSTKLVMKPQKLKKLNIGRLKDIVSKGVTPPKSRSLHNFLTEL